LRQAVLRETKYMKILSPSQLYDADRLTIEKEGITSWQLMERASLRAVESITELIDEDDQVCVLAGIGNNGGDGLAIAYHLDKIGYHVEVVLLKYANSFSKDCEQNLNRLKEKTGVKLNIVQKVEVDFSGYSVFIDAVFGIGLNRKMPDFVEDCFQTINQIDAQKIAIDVPSGLFLSELTPESSVVFKAKHTLTFQCPKLNFFLPHFGNYVGDLSIIDIGLDNAFIQDTETEYYYADEALVKRFLKTRERFSHKGTYGHVLLVGGQRGMTGCIVLSCRSAMRSGAGKVTAVVPKCGIDVLQATIPEAMLLPSDQDDSISKVNMPFESSIVGIGMGIGQSQSAVEALNYFITNSDNPLLIDADGLNILSMHKEWLQKLPSKSILTPHQGELKRLIGEWEDDYYKLEKLKAFSTRYDLVVVSKDAYTFVVYKDEVYINSTGNAGMATAGSGDVLSGLISGLVAQGYSTLHACILGVYLQGSSGDCYAAKYEQNTLIASDLIETLKEAFALLKK